MVFMSVDDTTSTAEFSLDLGQTADSLFKRKKIQRMKHFEKKVLTECLEPRERSN
jgi:hypothetical protein